MTERLARWCATHPWRTLLAWLAGVVLAVLAVGALLGDNLTSEAVVTNDAGSIRANDLIAERFPEAEEAGEVVVVEAAPRTVDDPAVAAALVRLRDEMVAAGVVRPPDPGPGADPAVGLPSADRTALLLPVDLGPDGADVVGDVVDVVGAADGRDGIQVSITGPLTRDHDFNELSREDLEKGELQFGLPAALLVLVLVFGALVSALIPVLLALVSIAVALGLTALVASGFELSVFVVNMLSGMGLALGIDYSLFVVSRVREERQAGKGRIDAIAAAGSTANRAVLFSGSAFVIAMTGLLLVQATIMRSLAVGAILVGIVSVVGALTLLPAVLALLGDRANAVRVPWLGRRIIDSAGQESRFWRRIVGAVCRRPAIGLIAGVAVLLLAASPLLGMRIGATGIETLPDSLASKQGFIALERAFPDAGSDPAVVVVDGRADSADVQAAIARLQRAVAAEGSFGAPAVRESPDRTLALVSFPVTGDALSDDAVDAVRDLRADLIPAAFEGSGAQAFVTGTTAENIDYFDVMDRWLPIVLVFVLGFSLILLTIAFRSIVVAGTAIVLNLLSVGAAYGLLVLVFQEGVGADLLGFQEVAVIEAWVPLFLFAVLFGLSMDYQVFLLSRIRERYSLTGDNRDAISFGIGNTARLITGAALIIVVVFVGFAAGDLVMFQQMGFGIAVALLIDATLVRSVLVPAAMALLGERNWYLPRWLGWLPHVEVEGHAAPAPPEREPEKVGGPTG